MEDLRHKNQDQDKAYARVVFALDLYKCGLDALLVP